MWIFGYGSLIWRPDFPHVESVVAGLRDWKRAFTQGSPDHRGTPEEPGRVVTLRPAPGAVCWGVAYRVHERDAADVLRRLDHREQGGYDRLSVSLIGQEAETSPWRATTYVAPPGNPHDLGEASLSEMVDQIAMARGPSGLNRAYVLRLHEALQDRQLGDPEVAVIANALVERAAP